jgi:hypothetical protein
MKEAEAYQKEIAERRAQEIKEAVISIRPTMSFPVTTKVYAVGHSDPTHRLVQRSALGQPSPVALSLSSKEDDIADLAEAIVRCHGPTTRTNTTEPVGLTKADDDDVAGETDDDETKPALETIVEAETQPHRLRVKAANLRLKVDKVDPKALCICGKRAMPNRAASSLAPPPGLTLAAPPGLTLAAPPGLTPTASTTPAPPGFGGCASPPAPPGLSAPPGAEFVSEACQVSKESLTTASNKRIEDKLKDFNNQSQHILKLVKAQGEQIEAQCEVLNIVLAQGEQLRVQSAHIEAQCEVLNMRSEQLKEMSVLLLAGVPLA